VEEGSKTKQGLQLRKFWLLSIARRESTALRGLAPNLAEGRKERRKVELKKGSLFFKK